MFGFLKLNSHLFLIHRDSATAKWTGNSREKKVKSSPCLLSRLTAPKIPFAIVLYEFINSLELLLHHSFSPRLAFEKHSISYTGLWFYSSSKSRFAPTSTNTKASTKLPFKQLLLEAAASEDFPSRGLPQAAKPRPESRRQRNGQRCGPGRLPSRSLPAPARRRVRTAPGATLPARRAARHHGAGSAPVTSCTCGNQRTGLAPREGEH